MSNYWKDVKETKDKFWAGHEERMAELNAAIENLKKTENTPSDRKNKDLADMESLLKSL